MRILGVFLLAITCADVFAGWKGPVDVMHGKWGGAQDEFGVEWGDSPAYGRYPALVDVASDGRLAVADVVNHRAKIYSYDGSLLYNLTPSVNNALTKYYFPSFVGEDIVIPLSDYYFYSRDGELIDHPPAFTGRVKFFGEIGGELYVASYDGKWAKYSSDGAMVKYFDHKPLELGHVRTKEFGYSGITYTRVYLDYPSASWIVPLKEGPCAEYKWFVDKESNLYCGDIAGSYTRYSSCGKEVASLDLPPSDELYEAAPVDSGVEDFYKVLESYSDLTIGDDGSLYASRITQEGYSIVKWYWVYEENDPTGGPDAPIDVNATVTNSHVLVSWRPSLQDPGCVTGYEVERAPSNGGPYAVIGTVDAGVRTYTDTTVESGNTYYYQLHALSVVENSPNTSEISISVP